MKNKKKTAGTVASSGGQKYINNKLSIRHSNTPLQIGQEVFPKMTGVYLENRKKENQCFHCEKWFDRLPFGSVKTQGVLRGSYVGICQGCINSLLILPPNVQKGFWQKVERNLKKARRVNTDD